VAMHNGLALRFQPGKQFGEICQGLGFRVS
jgi:hypothetical protein